MLRFSQVDIISSRRPNRQFDPSWCYDLQHDLNSQNKSSVASAV